jgi:CDP-4-dehydro-6-deoxyglucose reductase
MKHDQQLYRLMDRSQLAPSIVSYSLAPCGAPLQIQPGQYLLWRIQNQTIHCSVAEETVDGILRFHLRENTNNTLFANIKPNEVYSLEGPFGHCTIQTPTSFPLILVAGGTGYAPYNMLIPHILKQQLSSALYFYWGVECKEDWYAWDTLLHLEKIYPQFHFIPVLADTKTSWEGRTGIVHQAVLEDFPSLREKIVFASGPWPMIQTLSSDFKEKGLLEKYLFSDFLPSSK